MLGRLNSSHYAIIPGDLYKALDDTGDAPPTDSNNTASLLSRALDQIHPEVEEHTWAAFWNTAVLGHSATETAEELRMTAMAVRQAKSRILRRLRKQLGDA